ncbi:MAG: hypothetical protein Q9183_007807, partial [Haloplaca sp. 2 TL-2023]
NVEHFKAAAAAMDDTKAQDEFLRYCAIGRQLGYAMYLTLDMATFFDSVGIWKFESAKRLQKEAYRAWFVGLIFNALAGMYTLWGLKQREQEVDKADGEGVVESKKIARLVLGLGVANLTDCLD